MQARKVASVFAAREDAAISRLLLDAGWQCELCASAFDECHVGLVYLASIDPSALARMRHLVTLHRRIAWIAIVESGLIESDAIREFIIVHCIDYQTLPLDPQRLLITLGHAAGMARLARTEPQLNLDTARLEAEKNTLVAALRRTGWNARKSADLVGVSRATFYRLLERHGLATEHSVVH